MATLSALLPTALDFARRSDCDQKLQKIIEISEPTNEILGYLPWAECNQGTGHLTTTRTGYPSGTWRLLNQGVQPEKSQTVQTLDTTGMLADYAEVDKTLADLNGNSAEWRLQENAGTLIGMNQTFLSTLFYGNTAVNPERFTGLSPRFSAPSTTRDNAGYNMVDGGAADGVTAGCTSIWILGLGPNTLHGIYPKGMPMGWNAQDLGQQTKTDSNGKMLEVLRNYYQFHSGISLRDWRYVSRVCNVEVAALKGDYASGAKLWDLLTIAVDRIESLQGVTPVICCNRTIRSFMRRQIVNKIAPATLTTENIAGKRVTMFDSIPVLLCDGIVNTEAAVLDAAGTFVTQ